MVQFSHMLKGLARSFSTKKGRKCGHYLMPNITSQRKKPLIDVRKQESKEAMDTMVEGAKRDHFILQSSGIVCLDKSNNLVSAFSRRGEKGVNQDCFMVCEKFGGLQDMLFCGIFDGHGLRGHIVSKRIRDTMPSSLLCNLQDALAEASLDPNFDYKSDKSFNGFNIWKNCYVKTCAEVDQDLQRQHKFDSFHSGTTALTIVRQGDTIFIANVGDSRAVLATISRNGILVPVQLTIDSKPNLPQESERILKSNGRVFCLRDEPGVHRVWAPNGKSAGLAVSRAFGDFYMKDFGLVSVPDVTKRCISTKDQFVVLATDGVWEVMSNKEVVRIVSSIPDRSKAAECLVEQAKLAWKKKHKGIASDDISAVCLFFHSPPASFKKNPTCIQG